VKYVSRCSDVERLGQRERCWPENKENGMMMNMNVNIHRMKISMNIIMMMMMMNIIVVINIMMQCSH